MLIRLTLTLVDFTDVHTASETPSKSSVFSIIQHMASSPFSCSVGFKCAMLLDTSKFMAPAFMSSIILFGARLTNSAYQSTAFSRAPGLLSAKYFLKPSQWS